MHTFAFVTLLSPPPLPVSSDAHNHFNVTPTMSSIMFSWQPLAQSNGIITGYSLTVQRRISQLGLSDMSYLECVLQPGQQVASSISASTVAGVEPHENISALANREGVYTCHTHTHTHRHTQTHTHTHTSSPLSPTLTECISGDNLMSVCTSDSTLVISWNPPINHHGFITGYSAVVENNVTNDLPPHHTESQCLHEHSSVLTPVSHLLYPTSHPSPITGSDVSYYITVTPLDMCNSSVNSSSIINLTRELGRCCFGVHSTHHITVKNDSFSCR